MIRETSLEAYNHLLENGLLSGMRLNVWYALAQFQFSTANELFRDWKGHNFKTQANLHARLGELREMGMVKEHPKRTCSSSGRKAFVWEALAQDTPIQFEKSNRHTCKACGGKGFIEETQAILF